MTTDKGGTADVPDTPAVVISYDAAGNRTSMTDGTGTRTYHFDRLSRLSSEDKQFIGLSGVYTLSYEYTLTGAVKKVSDLSAGTSFTYDFDSVGHMKAITSTGLGTSAPIVSSMQYRAWGALKGMSYGNGTSLGLDYNNRELIKQYAVGGVKDGAGQVRVEGSDFQYCADSKVKFISDYYERSLQTISNHDRAFEYDHAGQLKQGLSGALANDFVNNTPPGPYDGGAISTELHARCVGKHAGQNGLVLERGRYSGYPNL